MQVSPKTTAKQIVTEFRRHGISIPQHAAWKAKTVLTGEDVAEQACQFALIPAYVEHFLEKDPDGTAVISINEATKQFEAVFISPSAASNSWLRNQKFLALDGALTSAAHENLLLLAATFDGKDLLNILSWAFVPTESEATWTWFIELCDQSFGKGMLNSIGTTVISDRQKGLLKAIPAVLPDVHKGFCCVHLLRNLNEKFKQSKGQLEPFFWTIVRALTEKDFERALGKFSKKFGKGPARYLDKIPHNKWAEYTFPGPRYGCVSSNIAECSNVLLKDARTMAPLALLTLIEEWGMGKFAEQSKAAEGRVDEFTAAATTRFLQEEATSREYDIIVSTNRTGFWSGLAKHPLSQSPDHKVTITIPFDYDIHEPTGLPYLQATCTLQECYINPFPVVSTAGLELDPDILPPSKKRKVGRPQKKRMEAGDGKGRKRRPCGECGKFGHLRSVCPRV
ncbi:hypothetical protein P7C70_g7646, partial [Phenoliferia sp. Uapishka_3]